MANRRWIQNPILKQFSKISIPVTDSHDNNDYQITSKELKNVVELATLDSESLQTITSFHEQRFLVPSIWNILDITGADDKPEIVQENNVGHAHLVVYGGEDVESLQGFQHYVVQCLTYIDSTMGFIRTTCRGVVLTQEGQYQQATQWLSSVDSADLAYSLARGATINGSQVASVDDTVANALKLANKLESELNVNSASKLGSKAEGELDVNSAKKLGSKTENQLDVLNAKTADDLKSNGTLGGKAISTIEYTDAQDIKRVNKIIGRNLITLLGASSAKDAFDKIRAMGTDYSKLQLGDYIDIPSITVGGTTLQNTSGNLRVEIQGFDHYYRVGDTESPHGILFGFRNCALTKRYNASDTTAGGYNGSELKKYVNNDFAKGLESAIGTIKTVHRLVDTHGSWSWTAEKCFLPTEVEVFGYQAWGRGGYYGGTSVQYPIYSLDPSRRIKTYNGSRQWWWEGTSQNDSTTNFCRCYSRGYADYNFASYVGGVSPAFYI